MFSDYLALIRFQIELHPGFDVQDLYKLLYQGILGAEHLLTDIDAAKRKLAVEWESQPAELTEPFYEPISPNGKIVRINLRPFKAISADWQEVWQAFYHSAMKFTGEKGRMVETWQQALKWIQERRLPLDWEAACRLDSLLREGGYPAGHHSANYRQRNRPSYRVVSKEKDRN